MPRPTTEWHGRGLGGRDTRGGGKKSGVTVENYAQRLGDYADNSTVLNGRLTDRIRGGGQLSGLPYSGPGGQSFQPAPYTKEDSRRRQQMEQQLRRRRYNPPRHLRGGGRYLPPENRAPIDRSPRIRNPIVTGPGGGIIPQPGGGGIWNPGGPGPGSTYPLPRPGKIYPGPSGPRYPTYPRPIGPRYPTYPQPPRRPRYPHYGGGRPPWGGGGYGRPPWAGGGGYGRPVYDEGGYGRPVYGGGYRPVRGGGGGYPNPQQLQLHAGSNPYGAYNRVTR